MIDWQYLFWIAFGLGFLVAIIQLIIMYKLTHPKNRNGAKNESI